MQVNVSKIVEGCKRKQIKYQQELYERFKELMFGICLRYFSNVQDAEDVLHEGFIKIFDKIGQYKGEGAFEGWMRRVMVTTALQKLRKEKNIINISDHQSELAENELKIERESENLTQEEMVKIIQDLSPRYRTIFNLYAIEGYSHKEISKMLNISEGTSKSNLSRARAILQKKIQFFYGKSMYNSLSR